MALSSVGSQRYSERELSKTKRRSGTRGELGYVYERKILMLGFYRAVKLKYDFMLDTNIEGFGAFDDVVFTYKESGATKEQRIFLQSKHSEDKNKKIKFNEFLKSGNADYSLYKYFIDYVDINRNFNKQGCVENKYFIIYTNCDFNCPRRDNEVLRIHRKTSNDYFIFRRLDLSSHKPLEIFSSVCSTNTKKRPAFYQFSDRNENNAEEKGRVMDFLKDKFKNLDEGGENKLRAMGQDEFNSLLEGFIGKLVFAVDQPNEKMLGIQIKEEIKQDSLSEDQDSLNEDQVDFIFEYVLDKIGQFRNQRKAKPLTESDNYFIQGKHKVTNYRALYPTLLYKNELRSLNLQFIKGLHKELNNFISSGKKLWLISSKISLLNSLVIFQTLNEETCVKYTYHDNIFLTWSDLHKGYMHILPAFEGMKQCLLIIVCGSTDPMNSKTSDIVSKIVEIVSVFENNLKRVIVIGPENHELPMQLKQKITSSYSQEHETIHFGHLTPESQKICLKTKKIRFQGKDERFSLQQLLGLEQFPVPEEILTKLNLGARELESLLKSPTVEVANEQPKLSDLESAHFKTYRPIEVEQLKVTLQENVDDVFAFVGEENEVKALLPSDAQRKLLRFEDGLPPITAGFIILLKAGLEEEQFKQLCHLVGEVCTVDSCIVQPAYHLLKKKRGGWVLMRTYCRDIYMKRHIYSVIIDKDKIKDLLTAEFSSDFVIFSGVNEEFLLNILEVNDTNEKYNFKKTTAVFLEESNAENEFERLIKDPTQWRNTKGIHWLKVDEREGQMQFQWYRSEGEIKGIHSVLAPKTKVKSSTSEESIVASKARFIGLADEPGMGKSTTLVHAMELMRKENPLLWVMKIDLNQHQALLTDCVVKTVEDLVSLLAEIDGKLADPLTRSILIYKLTCTGHVALLWDGFDEVKSEGQDAVLALFKFLKKETAATVWVTTREYDQRKLEECLSILGHSFDPLDITRQTDYLICFWETTLKLAPCKASKKFLEDCAREVIQSMERSFQANQADKLFICIPLQLRMLAEIYQEVVEKSCMEKISFTKLFKMREIHKKGSLYQQFVSRKYDIFLHEKQAVGESFNEESKKKLTEDYSEDYGLLAVQKLFDGEKIAPFISDEERTFSLNTLARIGFIQGNEGAVNFIHRTFAEYFAAKWFAKRAKNLKVKEFLGIQLFKRESKVLRCFFDHFLTRNLPLHRAVLEADESAFQKLLSESSDIETRDVLGRTALHLAAQEGKEEMAKELLEVSKDKFPHDHLDKNPLHYAALLEDETAFSLFNSVLDSTHQTFKYRNPLQYAAFLEASVPPSQIYSDTEETVGPSRTALILFCRNEIIYRLLVNSIDINLDDHIFRRPLHFDTEIGTSLFNNTECAGSELLKLVNEQDKAGKTPLYYAADNKHWDTACSLLLYGADVGVLTTDHKRALLRFAVSQTHRCYANQKHALRPVVGLLSIQVPEAVQGLADVYEYPRLLSYFFQHGHTKVIDVLLRSIENEERRIKIANENDNSYSPLRRISYISSYDEYVFKDVDYLKIITYFYERGSELGLRIDVNEADSYLSNAANEGFLETFKYLYKNGINQNASEPEKVRSNKDNIRSLFSNLYDLNHDDPWLQNLILVSRETFGWTRLHLAAGNKYVHSVEKFLDSPTFENINKKDEHDYTPLAYASAIRGKSKFIESLFVVLRNQSFDRDLLYEIVNAKNNINDMAPLHWVIYNGDFNSANTLLKNIDAIGFNQEQLFNIMNSRDCSGFNPIDCISGGTHKERNDILKLYLKYIISFNFSSQQCLTILSNNLLYRLINSGFENDAFILLSRLKCLPLDDDQRAYIVNMPDQSVAEYSELKRNTPLHAAATEGYCYTIVLSLLKNCAVFNAYNEARETPLDILYKRDGDDYKKTEFLLSSLDRLFCLIVDEQIIHVPEKLDELKETLNELKRETWIDPESVLNARNRERKTLLDLSPYQEVTDLLQRYRSGT